MPSYVDFNASKHFRDFLLTKTLNVPNGPQTFNANNYSVHNLNTFANVDPGDVEDNRDIKLLQSQGLNTFKPLDYFVYENLDTIPRKANLNLYPHFVKGQTHNLISIINSNTYDTESELFKFAAWNINTNPDGPFFARLRQNLYATTVGRVRLIDALEGNTATAINLLTGREPLIESNPRITVAKTLPGKGIDFLQTIAGVEFPWAEIPGDYLSNPRNPIISRTTANSEIGAVFQDTMGAVGSLFGIQRRPTITRKPSDLFIEYMGQRQKSTLFDNLSYSKYAPNYTTTARSQNSSKIFNFIDKTAQGVKNILGIEAPDGISYIGDDRGDDVKFAMNDFNERPVRSNYYLSLMFDPIQAQLFQKKKNIIDGGAIGGKLTWISSKSRNILGANNEEFNVQKSQFSESLSTQYDFRDDSILGITQEILETMPSDGGAARSHIANVIDQTSRIFRDGDVMLSKGSAIKYVNQFTGQESGVEYCRVWTKDRSYMNYSDTMKRTGNIRKFESSVLSAPWNLNIYPNSNAKGEFDASSTNMAQRDGGFFAKKYMFSIENLAWKTSDTPGFTYTDLPYCERGQNGGRIMWFPPYDLKINEVNNAKWESNTFLGRPEPIYTYQNTERSGTISFKVIVDHPSILNLLVRKHFDGMSDEESDNYIQAFFAGCENVDFYGLIRKYMTLTPDEVKSVMEYLNQNKKDTQSVIKNKSVLTPIISDTPSLESKMSSPLSYTIDLYFENARPHSQGDHVGYRSPEEIPSLFFTDLYTIETYTSAYGRYISIKTDMLNNLYLGLDILRIARTEELWGEEQVNDYKLLSSQLTTPYNPPTSDEFDKVVDKVIDAFENIFNVIESQFSNYQTNTTELKTLLENGNIKQINIQVGSRTSAPDSVENNLKLSYRRSHSVLIDFLFRISKNYDSYVVARNKYLKWSRSSVVGLSQAYEPKIEIPLKELGYDQDGILLIEETLNIGESVEPTSETTESNIIDCTDASNFLTSTYLRQSAPSIIKCRTSRISVKYLTKATDDNIVESPVNEDGTPLTERQIITVEEPSNLRKLSPPIDEIKKLIMKTLSECYYFKKLEEESPLQFSSLKEKLKYFHPAFHSMTPEGLNARLTFLHQCIRPGDTLPIKGMSDERDLNARNTTFGPPPICVMRIGDFYHSKIVIRDVNIDYDDNIWDFNPEGIGVQPMLANVQLQISFIGGHGLERPVERLQNALSSNFYANTEMYDPRSTATEDRSKFYEDNKFTKEFLDDLNRQNEPISSDSKNMVSSTNNVIQGNYIGYIENNILDYTSIIDDLFYNTEYYTKSFINGYNNVITTYGTKLGSMILHPDYRTINNYEVQIGASTTNLELLGNYPLRNDLETLVLRFKTVISGKTATENITSLIGLNNDMTPSIAERSEKILNPYVLKTITEIIDDIPTDVSYLKTVETRRNKLIVDLDKLNFIVENGYDGKIEKGTYTGVNFTGYTASLFYGIYKNAILFIQENQDKFSEDLDNTYNFNGITMTTSDLSYFLKILLKEKKEEILDLYKKDSIFTDNPKIHKNIERRLDKFLSLDPSEKNFRITRYPVKINNNDISFGTTDEFSITSDTVKENLANVHKTRGNKTTRVLNYHRPVFGTSG